MLLDGQSEIVLAEAVAVMMNIVDADVLLNERVYKDKHCDG